MKTIILLVWLVPWILLIGFWLLVDLYSILWGSDKDLLWCYKLQKVIPSFSAIIVSGIPIFNLVLFLMSLIMFFGPDKKKYL